MGNWRSCFEGQACWLLAALSGKSFITRGIRREVHLEPGKSSFLGFDRCSVSSSFIPHYSHQIGVIQIMWHMRNEPLFLIFYTPTVFTSCPLSEDLFVLKHLLTLKCLRETWTFWMQHSNKQKCCPSGVIEQFKSVSAACGPPPHHCIL